MHAKCIQKGKIVYIKYILFITTGFQLLQKDYIKVNKFYEMHIFHDLFTILKEQKLQFYHKVLKFSAEIIKMWKTFLSCHVYINLSTSFVDNCVDKSVVF